MSINTNVPLKKLLSEFMLYALPKNLCDVPFFQQMKARNYELCSVQTERNTYGTQAVDQVFNDLAGGFDMQEDPIELSSPAVKFIFRYMEPTINVPSSGIPVHEYFARLQVRRSNKPEYGEKFQLYAKIALWEDDEDNPKMIVGLLNPEDTDNFFALDIDDPMIEELESFEEGFNPDE
jgi:hypothetical protein